MVTPKLWSHQCEVLTDLVVGHYLLLWSMGTGKTAALVVAGEAVGGRGLWICPAMLIPQTIVEIRRWRPRATMQVITSGKDRVREDRDIVIVSYDMMRALPIWRQLFRLSWDHCTCDEGHALKNTASVRARAFYGARETSPGALYRRCQRVWVATGTPILNSPDEIWPHLSRLFPELIPDLKKKQDFLDRYCVIARRTFGNIVVGGRNLLELRQILTNCSSRLALEDVTDLPPLLVDTIHVRISPEHRRELEGLITDEQAREIDIVLTQLEGGDRAAWQRLRAMLLPLASMRRVLALAKAEAAVDLIDEELEGGTDRVVLFGVHLDALHHIAERASRRFETALLTGATPADQRQRRIDKFREGGTRLLVASTRVAGFGLNLQCARRCFHLETEWTPAAFDQAVARLYRAGQRRPVRSSTLAVTGSIDARVASVISQKRQLIEEIIA